MRSIVFRVAALATAIGVAFVVATGGRGCSRGEADPVSLTTTSAASSAIGAAPTAAAAPAPTSDEEEKGVIGPSTKADPHAIRRAVNGLAGSAPPAPPPSSTR